MNVDIRTTISQPAQLEARLEQLRLRASRNCRPLAAPYPQFKLFLSVCDGVERARVVSAAAATFDEAWSTLVAHLFAEMNQHQLRGRWLRLDWVTNVERVSVHQLNNVLAKTKRNYFRLGLAFDEGLHWALMEQELNANAALYGGGSLHHAVLNEHNLLKYAATRFSDLSQFTFNSEDAVFAFSVSSFFCEQGEEILPLLDQGLESGRRDVAQLSETDLLKLIRDCSTYLAHQVKPSGTFTYGMHPCFDRDILTYNALRHASTTYAMIEAWEVTRDPNLKDAIDRALSFLSTSLIQQIDLPDGASGAFLVEHNKEIKLGGNAVAILALVKFMSVTGSDQYRDLAERLARGIDYMQDATSGAFVHVLNFPDLTVKDAYRVIYYDGEATFALMRLYAITLNPRLMAIVEKAFQYFIAQEHWKHHDHWLAYCVNELTRYKPDPDYFRFAVNNISGYLDFVEHRETTFPTLLELMMATQRSLQRMSEFDRCDELLDQVDLSHFERALEKRAHHLLNGHFWPEMAMFFQNPDRILGSCFIRHHAFRVRIDDVEHYLSGFVAYLGYLKERNKFKALISEQQLRLNGQGTSYKTQARKTSDTCWNRDNLVAATGGRWLVPPDENWTANGICTYLPAYKDGAIVALRSAQGDAGMPVANRGKLPKHAALMLTDPLAAKDATRPVLLVDNNQQAIMSMARYARARMAGQVVGVTGSAGKTTTVAMLGHALQGTQQIYTTEFNANLPVGVAWNIASAPWNAAYLVLELAIGRMRVSAGLALPDVAIFTNVLPAHLSNKSTVKDIARTKSAIFSGMKPGGIAILNSGMAEWHIVEQAARERDLNIVTFGTLADCQYRLTAYDAGSNRVYATINGTEITYKLGASGQHMALNSLAVLAAVDALGESREAALSSFEHFEAVPGRGKEMSLTIAGKEIFLIDDAYNANPGSMAAALSTMSERQGSRRIAVLGEMAELGPDAIEYHRQLAPLVNASHIDRIHVVGELYDSFWAAVSPDKQGRHFRTRDEVLDYLLSELCTGDLLLIKGSHSTGMHNLVEDLIATSK